MASTDASLRVPRQTKAHVPPQRERLDVSYRDTDSSSPREIDALHLAPEGSH